MMMMMMIIIIMMMMMMIKMMLRRTFSDFFKCELPEAQNLGICIIFRDLAFERDPGPWKGDLDPKIEVSDPPNKQNKII